MDPRASVVLDRCQEGDGGGRDLVEYNGIAVSPEGPSYKRDNSGERMLLVRGRRIERRAGPVQEAKRAIRRRDLMATPGEYAVAYGAREDALDQAVGRRLVRVRAQHTSWLMRKSTSREPVSRPTPVDGGEVEEELNGERGRGFPDETPMFRGRRAGE